MTKTILAGMLGATVAISGAAMAASDQTIEEQIQSYRAAMMEFGQQLRGELQGAMKEGGPTAAVEVCHTRAPEIAEAVSAETGLTLGRTSLKPRAQAPDAWETTVLESFETQKQGGTPVSELEFFEVVDVDGTDTLRYMRAIGTDTVCLACHGTEVDANIKAKIERLYPQDQAMGFSEGDIRGAFSISAAAP